MTAKTVVLEDVEEFDIEVSKSRLSFQEELLKDISIDLKVMAGTVALDIARLYELKGGDVLKMAESAEAPMLIMYGEHVLAEGVLVAVDDYLGMRITKVNHSHDVKQ